MFAAIVSARCIIVLVKLQRGLGKRWAKTKAYKTNITFNDQLKPQRFPSLWPKIKIRTNSTVIMIDLTPLVFLEDPCKIITEM